MKSRNALHLVSDSACVMSDVSPDDLTLIRLHCDYLRRTGARRATLEQRRGALRRLAIALPGRLLDATFDDLERWQASLTVSTSSISTYTNHVVGFYRWAVEAGHIAVDPSTRLPRPKPPKRAARPIPERDLEVAIASAPEPIRTWLILAAFMGLRAMEVAAIRREDVAEIGGRLVLSGVGKGGKPFRLPVPQGVEPYLRQHMSAQRGPLWRTPSGGPWRPAKLSQAVGRFFRSIGMPYTLHWCRHHFGTAAYRQTRDLLLTQDLMRHSTPASTRLYVDTTRAEAAAALDRLSRHVPGARKQRRAS